MAMDTMSLINIYSIYSIWVLGYSSSVGRYRQFLALHAAVSEQVRREDMPTLPGKRILGSSIDPSFAEARGLALQVIEYTTPGLHR